MKDAEAQVEEANALAKLAKQARGDAVRQAQSQLAQIQANAAESAAESVAEMEAKFLKEQRLRRKYLNELETLKAGPCAAAAPRRHPASGCPSTPPASRPASPLLLRFPLRPASLSLPSPTPTPTPPHRATSVCFAACVP